ncbi:MAG: shikimate kinase [Spirochaetaceae bacterium]|nr:MAG: shikimate kinase [Spirochaetaceae bacterium]
MPRSAGRPENSPTAPHRIAMIGFMGSGKTTVGRLVASRLGYRFLDLDVLIVENAGKSIREIFDQDGEERFRQIESDALYSLREMNRLVIATGGGAPIRQENQEFFENLAQTFYLEVSFPEFLKRTGRDRARPLLDRPERELRNLYDSRLPVYRSLGQRILTDSRRPEEITAEILNKLKRS